MANKGGGKREGEENEREGASEEGGRGEASVAPSITRTRDEARSLAPGGPAR